ncbi:MAG: FtsW/RodA/SpoVE family cell cycle protein [Proteobacteria bacterium]|nr:FtsW/RodA/SpoVE family cell cycle protein [Pseudomonadota bacterium]
MSISRAQRGGLADWWFTVDRVALFAVLALIGIGLMLAFAASPAATGGPMSAGDFRYAIKQIAFALIAGGILVFTSLLSLRAIKLGAAIIFALSVICSCAVLFTGSEVLGAKRWIDLGFMTLQPSEFLKPSFAILGAAVLADPVPIKFRNITLRKEVIAFLLLLPALLVLTRQPDYGQTAVLLALWGALLFFNGLPLIWTSILGGIGSVLLTLLYLFVPYIHHRVEQFVDADKTGYQAGLAMKAFEHGGLLGVGPGAGTIKYRIPDVHSDFIFAVAGEEFGVALCGLIVLVFCILSVRLLLRATRARDSFAQLAAAALAFVVALQAFINMGVATNMLPAKGMTLPFISSGGSSLFAVAMTMGFALSLTRQRPKIGEQDHSAFRFLREVPV